MSMIGQKESNKAILASVRSSHESIPRIQRGEINEFDWHDARVVEFANAFYREIPHWHHWKGFCQKGLPFEVWVGCSGIFGAAWFYDIMLRKARDRAAPEGWERTKEWRGFLDQLLDYIESEVSATRDLEAEERHRRTARPVRKWRHLLNKFLWGH